MRERRDTPVDLESIRLESVRSPRLDRPTMLEVVESGPILRTLERQSQRTAALAVAMKWQGRWVGVIAIAVLALLLLEVCRGPG